MAEIELPEAEELEEHLTNPFTKKVALTTAIFAVFLAITSLGGNNAMKEMILAQQQASDQWAFYQAKVIREHLYRQQKERLELELIEKEALKPEARAKYEAMLQKTAKEAERYGLEKKDIRKEAEKLEHERDVNRNKDPYFDYAEVLLQIAIVMASIAILAHSRSMYVFSIVSAALGTLLSLNGFLMLVRLPFFH
ncbi:MAG: DUF4337 domain-containing protein [Deltaproteobacteria bacterium]|nr:MAG: DUF4337 domain-containing protein [Deltaproteobacteria bacterium]